LIRYNELGRSGIGIGSSVLPPGELDETYASSFILAHSLHHCDNMTSFTKPEVHNVSQKKTESLPQVACTYREFGKIWACSFWNASR